MELIKIKFKVNFTNINLYKIKFLNSKTCFLLMEGFIPLSCTQVKSKTLVKKNHV